MDSETRGLMLIVIAVLGVFIAIQPLLPSTTQPFSELGILGPQQTISNYPTSVSTNQPFLLYCYVGNHEGVSEYYQVIIKLGNANTQISNTTSANAPQIASFSRILGDGQNATFPISIAISQSGTNLRVLFELWTYNPSTSSFTYTGLWNQLWLNVTS